MKKKNDNNFIDRFLRNLNPLIFLNKKLLAQAMDNEIDLWDKYDFPYDYFDYIVL